jgi:hypothetical protein
MNFNWLEIKVQYPDTYQTENLYPQKTTTAKMEDNVHEMGKMNPCID